MISRYKSLARSLNSSGFVLGDYDRHPTEIMFVRKGSLELFERIEVYRAHQRDFSGFFAGAGVDCSVVPGRTALKGLAEWESLTVAGSDTEGGWTPIANKADFDRWTERLVEVAPIQARDFAERVGPQLLVSTQAARKATRGYLERCARFGSLEETTAALEAIAGGSQVKKAQNMIRAPIIYIPNGKMVYYVAASRWCYSRRMLTSIRTGSAMNRRT